LSKGEHVRGKSLKFALLLVALLALAAAGCGGGNETSGTTGGTEGGGEGGTLVFGAASDPVVLDGALVYDGESLRVIEQIFEGLTSLKPGTTDVEPGLAESWETSSDGLTWTFHLRQGIKFQDGTEFNADAVCFNFDRWYNFPEPFQLDTVSYYWKYGFGGGFAKPGKDQPGPDASLYKSCEAVDAATVELNLTKPSATLLSTLTLPSLSIASPAALKKYGADEGTVDADGNFQPTGTYGTEHPVGTGAFKFESWTRGDKLVLVRNDDYWGEKPKLEQVIFKPIPESAARLQALQTGEIQGYSGVEPQDFTTVEGDSNLQILKRPALNVGYIGFNQAIPPLDKLEVRQAIAHAINRQAVVDSFYGGLGEVAKEFQPPGVFGYADDVTEYEYDPEMSKQLLQDAGLTLPVTIDFWYPTDVTRSYMPDPKRNFEAFTADLQKAGFKVRPHTAPWDSGYLDTVSGGKAQVYLIGWIADFGDPDNFLGTFFQQPALEWGTKKFPNKEVMDILNKAEAEPDVDQRTQLYEEANRKIMDWLPGLPYVHAESALAFLANVKGYVPSPVEVELFKSVSVQ
jgi:peptide/nickel transport system substrate-binding protein